MKRLALLVCCLLLLVGCDKNPAPAPAPTPTDGVPKDLTCTLAYYDEGGWNPLATCNETNLPLFSLAYEGLFELDGQFRATPVLCGTQTRRDNNTWRFTLTDATFSNNEPVTAYDVVYSYQLARNPTSAYAGRFLNIDTVRALGSKTVEITTKSPNANLPRLLDIPVIEKSADGKIRQGTGAYEFVQEGEGYALVRRQGWRDEAALPFDKIALTPVGSLPQLASELTAGSVSLAAIDATDTSASWGGDYAHFDFPSTRMQYLGFNCKKTSLQSPLVRRALACAMDRAGAVSDYAGLADPAALPLHPSAVGYDATLAETLAYNPTRAKETLAAAKAAGRSFTLLVNAENTGKLSLANRITDNLNAIGVHVTVDAVPFSEFVARLQSGNFDLFLGEVRMAADFDATTLLSPGGGLNYGGYENKLLSEKLYGARATGNLTEFLRMFVEEVPVAPILFKRDTLLTQKNFFKTATPVVGNPFYHFYDWETAR